MSTSNTTRRALLAGDRVRPPMTSPTEIGEGYSYGGADYLALVGGDGDPWNIPLSEADTWAVDEQAPGPADRLSPHDGRRALPLSDELRRRFHSLVYESGRPWSDLLRMLVPAVQAWGYDVWVVGGAVRDILLGKEPYDVKDLDLSGTMPPHRMRRIIEGLIELHPEFVRSGWRVNVSGEDILHVSAGPINYQRPGSHGVKVWDSFVQYCPLRLRYQRDPRRWYLGADLVADCAFRDVTLNALFYDPVGGVVHAPERQFLTDLGLPDSDLANWTPAGGDTARGTIRPIGLLPPSATPDKWALKGFARLVKSISKFPDLDATPVTDWYTEHRIRIAHDLNMTYPDRRGAPIVAGRGHLASFLKSFNVRVDDDLIGLCGDKGLPEDALNALEMVREVRSHLGAREDVLRGWGLRRVESIGGVLVVGDDVLPGLAQLNPGTVNELILPSIGGTGERVVRHVVHGSTTIRAHAIDSPVGLFVELDDAGRPWQADMPL